MKHASKAFRINKRLAENSWGRLSSRLVTSLRTLTSDYSLSVARGDIICLDGNWYITHSGLLRLASRRRCAGIQAEIVRDCCDPTGARWAFRATVFPCDNSVGFVGFGDADPSNVSLLVRGAEMRVAETRAVNRALRKAYGIGICSVEEIGTIPNQVERLSPQKANGASNCTGPKVRDRLRQIIRQHNLDPELVKAYAVKFCGTKTLREATRERVEHFVQQLADGAAKDRIALVSLLNSYSEPKQEVVA
jgi:hypothetical protein